VTDKFNFYTALALLVMLPFLFLLSFIAGFVTVWFAIPSSTDTMIYIEDEESFHQACFSGMRRGIE